MAQLLADYIEAIFAWFGAEMSGVTKTIQVMLTQTQDAALIASQLTFNTESFYEMSMPYLQEFYNAGAADGLAQINEQVAGKLSREAIYDICNLLDQDALDFAKLRAGDLVGMREVAGKLIANPSAKWQITDTTRNFIRDQVSKAVEEGWSHKQLADALINEEIWAKRATMIARTELAFAHTSGQFKGYQESGCVDGKKSIMSNLHTGTDECDTNAEAGIIPLMQLFPSGDMHPPYHPNCECDIIPIINDDF